MNTQQRQKIVCLSFDDGYRSQYDNALPILEKYGFKASFAIVTAFPDNKSGYMTWKEIGQLHSKGMDIVSHGVEHIDLTPDLDKTILHNELSNSKKELAAHGILTEIFVYPYGNYGGSSLVQNAVRDYYQWARGSYKSYNLENHGKYNLPSVVMSWKNPENFLIELMSSDKLSILQYHNVLDCPQGPYDISTNEFEEQLMHLKSYGHKVLTLKEALG